MQVRRDDRDLREVRLARRDGPEAHLVLRQLRGRRRNPRVRRARELVDEGLAHLRGPRARAARRQRLAAEGAGRVRGRVLLCKLSRESTVA